MTKEVQNVDPKDMYEHTEFGAWVHHYRIYKAEFGTKAVAFNKKTGVVYCSGNPSVVHSWIGGLRAYSIGDIENYVVIDTKHLTQALVNKFHNDEGCILKWYEGQMNNPQLPVIEEKKPKPKKERISSGHKTPRQNTWIQPHIQGDLSCAECQDDFPIECECAGIIHAFDGREFCDECVSAFAPAKRREVVAAQAPGPKTFRVTLTIDDGSGIERSIYIPRLRVDSDDETIIWNEIRRITKLEYEVLNEQTVPRLRDDRL